jgi:hypothetical protein
MVVCGVSHVQLALEIRLEVVVNEWFWIPEAGPLNPRSRRESGRCDISGSCHKRRFAAQQTTFLFDDLVSAAEQ